MKTKFLLSITAVLIFVSSCKKETNKDITPPSSSTPPVTTVTTIPDPLTSSEAKMCIDASTNNITNDIEGLSKAEGFVALNNMTGVTTPFGNPLKSAFNVVKSSKLKRLKTASGSFDFEASKGIWEYNNVTKSVDKKSSDTKCVLKFPSDSTKMNVNDATITIYEYSETFFIDNSYQWPDTSFQPTKIIADMKIGVKVVIDVKFAASYTTTGEPKTLDASVYVVPYALNVQYIDGGVTQTLNGSFKNGAKTILATGITFTWPSATDRSTPTSLEGYVQLDNIKAKGIINIFALNSTTTATPIAADFNNNIKIEFTKADNGALIGTLKAYDEKDANNQATVVPYIIYSDGTTKENAITFASTFIEKIEAKLPTN